MNEPVQVANESNADQMVPLTEVFHRINKLIPESQDLEIISPKTIVADALIIMEKNRFSQLPVVAGEEVLGIFSYRSFARKAIDFGNGDGKINLSNMTVDEFIEEVNFVHIKEDLDQTFEPFGKKDVVLVGDPEHLEGILSPLDLASYLYKIALPFLLLAEIELVLRRLVNSCLNPAELQESANNIL
jgi:CBS domain-containing protein